MLERLNAKDKQMNELILQVAAMNSSGHNKQVQPVAPQGPRAPKRKADETDASQGTGSDKDGTFIAAQFKLPSGRKG